MILDDNEALWGLALLLAGLGAVHLGLTQVMDTNVLVDMLDLGSDVTNWTYIGASVAGGIVFVDGLDEYVLD